MKLEELYQKIELAYQSRKPFAVYRKPNSLHLVGLFQKGDKVHYLREYDQKGFVFAPFNSNENLLFIPLDSAEYYSADLSDLSNSRKPGVPESKIDLKLKKQYLNLLEKAIRNIKQGAAKKIVLSRKETVLLSTFSIQSLLEKLLHFNPNAMTYVWFHPDSGLWMGATPETLLAISKNTIKTMALAGTQTFQGILDVEWKRKEKEEQQYVTDYITNALTDVVSLLEISEPYSVQSGNLLHLRTDIIGKLIQNNSLESILKRLHPTPAVCGVPKDRAHQFILENEKYKRGFYTGFLGELNIDNTTELFVNLRCTHIENLKAHIFVGGGITADSDPDSEWQETVAKSRVIKKALAIS